MGTSMYANKRLNIVKLIIQQTGTYHEQYRRPYVTSLNAQSENMLLTAVAGANSISSTTLSKATMGFMNPSATPEQQVYIPNGWNTPRLRFLLELRSEDYMGSAASQFITGYTEYSDLSMHDKVDPKMMFYINNISQTRTVTHRTPLGTQTYMNLVDSSQLLVNNAYTGIPDPNKMYSLRPENVIEDIDLVDLRQGEETVFNTSTTLVQAPMKSNRKNNVAPIYVANMLNSYLQTARSDQYDTHSSIVQNMRPSVASLSCMEDVFLMFIQQRRNQRGYGHSVGNTFTLEDLVALDPNTPNVMRLANFAQGGFHSVNGSNTNGWGGSDGITQFAANIAQSLPAYMSQFCFNVVHLVSTNHTVNGEIATVISNLQGFNNALDLSKEAAAFIYRLESELLAGLSYGNTMPFSLEVNCDMMGETWIELSLNGEPVVAYVTPTFCDSLTAPIVTMNEDNLHGIANDFSRIMSQVVEADSGSRGIFKPIASNSVVI